MIRYLKLFRPDAALISMVSYLIGAAMAGGPDALDIKRALLLTIIPVNFIYSINCWADRDLDAISKPYRPIPQGLLSAQNALKYCIGLLAASIILPFFLYTSCLAISLSLLLPLLGIVYSIEPFRLRNRPWLDTLTISLGLVLPMILAWVSRGLGVTPPLPRLSLFLIIWLYCLGTVSLKKIEETEEDQAAGIPNLYLIHGNKFIYYSFAVLLLTLVLTFALPLSKTAAAFTQVLSGSTLLMILIFEWSGLPLQHLYNWIIRMVIVESAIFIISTGYIK